MLHELHSAKKIFKHSCKAAKQIAICKPKGGLYIIGNFQYFIVSTFHNIRQ